jgi:D-inositol-3-phosphate glycosyltransferase
MMKVMMFDSETALFDNTQTNIHCKQYLHFLRLAECKVTFVQYHGAKRLDLPNVTCRYYPRRYRRVAKLLGPPTVYYLRKQSMRLLWRLVRPDICHAHWIGDELWQLARAGLRPLVATAWGSDLNVAVKAAADNPLRRKVVAALRSIDHLIVDSDDMAATAEQLAGKKMSTTVLPIGIDTEQFRPGLYQQRKEWRERLGIGLDATVLISARQLGANYRPAEIINAFAALNDIDGGQIYLVMRTFGHRIGVSLNELRELADQLHVSDRIRWVDDLEYSKLPGLYAASDLAVNFPVMDAFPVTFLECFACGVPVVSNRLTSYQSNGASDYLFFTEGDSVDGLKTAIEAAIARLDQLKTVAAAAREHVMRNFDERVSARILRQTYDVVLERRRRYSPPWRIAALFVKVR